MADLGNEPERKWEETQGWASPHGFVEWLLREVYSCQKRVSDPWEAVAEGEIAYTSRFFSSMLSFQCFSDLYYPDMKLKIDNDIYCVLSSSTTIISLRFLVGLRSASRKGVS